MLEEDLKVARRLATIELPLMDKLVRERFPASVFESGDMDLSEIRESFEYCLGKSDTFVRLLFLFFLLMSFDYFNSGVKFAIVGLSVESLNGIGGFLLLAIACCIVISEGYDLRKRYFAALIRTYILKREPVEKWLIRHDELLRLRGPMFLENEVKFLHYKGSRPYSEVQFVNTLQILVFVPFFVAYAVISFGTVSEVIQSSDFGFFAKLVTIGPFLAANIGFLVQQLFYSRNGVIVEERIENELMDALKNMGRPAFESRCRSVEVALSRFKSLQLSDFKIDKSS